MSRGEVNNDSRFRQRLLYEGIRYAKITPTDVDAFIDFRDRLYVFAEVKYKDKAIDLGQEIAIKRLVDSSHCPPKRHSIALHCRHDIDVGDVYLRDTRVIRCYYAGQWVAKNASFIDAVDALVNKFVPELKAEKNPAILEEGDAFDWSQCPF